MSYIPERDTMCANSDCFKWTHILTPGGNGIVYCSESCKPKLRKGGW